MCIEFSGLTSRIPVGSFLRITSATASTFGTFYFSPNLQNWGFEFSKKQKACTFVQTFIHCGQ